MHEISISGEVSLEGGFLKLNANTVFNVYVRRKPPDLSFTRSAVLNESKLGVIMLRLFLVAAENTHGPTGTFVRLLIFGRRRLFSALAPNQSSSSRGGRRYMQTHTLTHTLDNTGTFWRLWFTLACAAGFWWLNHLLVQVFVDVSTFLKVAEWRLAAHAEDSIHSAYVNNMTFSFSIMSVCAAHSVDCVLEHFLESAELILLKNCRFYKNIALIGIVFVHCRDWWLRIWCEFYQCVVLCQRRQNKECCSVSKIWFRC